jgi:hypothetical protein
MTGSKLRYRESLLIPYASVGPNEPGDRGRPAPTQSLFARVAFLAGLYDTQLPIVFLIAAANYTVRTLNAAGHDDAEGGGREDHQDNKKDQHFFTDTNIHSFSCFFVVIKNIPPFFDPRRDRKLGAPITDPILVSWNERVKL